MLTVSRLYPQVAVSPARPLIRFRGNEDKDYAYLRCASERGDSYGTAIYTHSRQTSDLHLAAVLGHFLKRNDTVLEIGCNRGNNLLPLGERYHAYGVDVDAWFVQKLNEAAAQKRRLSRRVQAAQWDMAEDGSQPPQWPDLRGQCGAIYAVHVLSHFSDGALADLVAKLTPYLKPGGLFIGTIIDPRASVDTDDTEDTEHCLPDEGDQSFIDKHRAGKIVTGGTYAHSPQVVERAFQGFRLVPEYSRRFKPGELDHWNLPERRLRWVVYQLPGPVEAKPKRRFNFSALMSGMRSRLGYSAN